MQVLIYLGKTQSDTYRKNSTKMIVELVEAKCVLVRKGETPGGHKNRRTPHPCVDFSLRAPSANKRKFPFGEGLEYDQDSTAGGAINSTWTPHPLSVTEQSQVLLGELQQFCCLRTLMESFCSCGLEQGGKLSSPRGGAGITTGTRTIPQERNGH